MLEDTKFTPEEVTSKWSPIMELVKPDLSFHQLLDLGTDVFSAHYVSRKDHFPSITLPLRDLLGLPEEEVDQKMVYLIG